MDFTFDFNIVYKSSEHVLTVHAHKHKVNLQNDLKLNTVNKSKINVSSCNSHNKFIEPKDHTSHLFNISDVIVSRKNQSI